MKYQSMYRVSTERILLIHLVSAFFLVMSLSSCDEQSNRGIESKGKEEESLWRGWNKYQIKPEDELAKYGRELIENTA